MTPYVECRLLQGGGQYPTFSLGLKDQGISGFRVLQGLTVFEWNVNKSSTDGFGWVLVEFFLKEQGSVWGSPLPLYPQPQEVVSRSEEEAVAAVISPSNPL